MQTPICRTEKSLPWTNVQATISTLEGMYMHRLLASDNHLRQGPFVGGGGGGRDGGAGGRDLPPIHPRPCVGRLD